MDDGCFQLEESLLSMDRVRCRALLEFAMKQDGLTGLERMIGPTLTSIGNRWESGDLALTQVYMSGRICESLLDELCPPASASPPEAPRIGVAVLLDHHQLGKRIVSAALRSGGFQVLDLGQGVEPEELAEMAQQHKIAILMVSVLMLSSALHVKDLRIRLGEIPDRPHLVVGGAPFRFHPELWREVGADAMGKSGLDAPCIAQRLLGVACAR